MGEKNKVVQLLDEILGASSKTILYKGRKTYALGEEACPVDTAAQYVINELHKLVAAHAPAKKPQA
jgi:hypothetical protein